MSMSAFTSEERLLRIRFASLAREEARANLHIRDRLPLHPWESWETADLLEHVKMFPDDSWRPARWRLLNEVGLPHAP